MAARSTLSKFSPILNGFRTIGVSACSIDENDRFYPVNSCEFYTKWMLVFMSLIGVLSVATWNFIHQATVTDFNLANYLYYYATSSKSELDAISFVAPVVATFLIGISVAMTSWKMGKNLSVFEDHVELKFPSVESRNDCKAMLHVLFCPILILLEIIALFVGFFIIHFNSADESGSGSMAAISTSLSHGTFFAYNTLFIALFMLIYKSTVQTLKNWSEALKDNPQWIQKFGFDYTQSLKLANLTFSDCLFYLITYNVIQSIFIIFRGYSFVLELIKYQPDNTDIFLAFGSIAFGSIQIGLIYTIALSSQQIMDANAELVELIQCKQKSGLMTMEDHGLAILTKELEDFRGFEGKGYFHVNKEFLVGCVANFVTYFIILIQFNDA